VTGLVLGIFLISSMFAGVVLAETKGSENKTKTSIKKYIEEIKKPIEDKTAKIIKIKNTRVLTALYVVVIEICAGNERLYSPELNIKSDKDSRTVKVVGFIMPKNCKTVEFFIRADDPNSISVTFSDTR
jgi:gas vesicle protein